MPASVAKMNREQRDLAPVGVIGESTGDEPLGDLGERERGGDRRVGGERAGDRSLPCSRLENLTRTVIVRPARCLARSRPATRSARCPSTERISSGVGSFRPNADCAPTECALGPLVTRRSSSLAASAHTLAPIALPSSDRSASSPVAAS